MNAIHGALKTRRLSNGSPVAHPAFTPRSQRGHHGRQHVISQAVAGVARAALGEEERVYGKVTWRLIPFLFLCYVAAYLDRVNIGFAKL